MPVTTPDVFTVAILEAPEVHTPPDVALANAVVALTHTVEAPVIVPALAEAFTVTTRVAATLPQLLVTV